ncbi:MULTISPECIES: hypothetical protein [Haloferax]|uniref:DUF91 domain-containing protein n=2 Tax=Haloferax TaxID=2251 RepID=A0A6G1Z1B4_9EURY|nr:MULTISPECIES: hypothetical protein [Haloferax]KAB1187529.1 hypothetical protein Hfx1149_05575 [Haloferax sp. CBA1149]MRW80181.1 hypothetical protein [Haloferax marinisediminis]
MDGGILLEEDGTLIEMTEQPYEYESVLQKSLVEYPRLLAGDQMNGQEPKQWALIGRELSVPDAKGGGERWSADHLFIDQDGVPTVVEVKRAEDTRIRREVVGQLLDYISHACLYWDGAYLREQFTETCEEHGRSPEQVLTAVVGEDDTGDVWELVEKNLRSRQVRLLFVADDLPSELKRVIEFLNEEFSSVEVFGVEVKQYAGESKTAFVPRLYGQTEDARSAKSSTTRPTHDEDDLLADVAAKEREGTLSRGEAAAIRDLYEFIQDEADSYDFGGSANVSVTARWEVIGGSNGMFTVNAKGEISFWQPAHMHNKGEATWDRRVLEGWYADLAAIDAASVDPVDGETKFPVGALVDDDAREAFKRACLDFASAIETRAE